MDAHDKVGIISRNLGPKGITVSDIKHLLSHIWRKSPEVLLILKEVEKRLISPHEASQRLFIGGSGHSLVLCFLILVAFNDEETLEIIKDLEDHIFDGVDEAEEAFRVACSRHKNIKKEWENHHHYK